MILDIGKNTIIKILKLIDSSKTIFWNGPAGYFENKTFLMVRFQLLKKYLRILKENIVINRRWWRYHFSN